MHDDLFAIAYYAKNRFTHRNSKRAYAHFDTFLAFRIKTLWTCFMFASSSFVITAYMFLFSSINCIGDQSMAHAIDTYCWIKTMFILPKSLEMDGLPTHKGIPDSTVVRHYYQFVHIILILQALSFLAPYYFWTKFDSKRLESLKGHLWKLDPLNQDEFMDGNGQINENKMKKYTKDIAKFLYNEIGKSNEYAYFYILCEVIAIAVLLLNITIMHYMLECTFLTYGIDVLLNFGVGLLKTHVRNIPLESFTYRSNPITYRVFPKATRCTLTIIGPGGNLVPYDSLCVLPLNVVNELIYVVLWLWLAYAVCISILGFLFWVMSITSAKVRYTVLKFRLKFGNTTNRHLFGKLLKKMSFSDWLVIHLVQNNTEKTTFANIVSEMSQIKVSSLSKSPEILKEKHDKDIVLPLRRYTSIDAVNPVNYCRNEVIKTDNVSKIVDTSDGKGFRRLECIVDVHQDKDSKSSNDSVAFITL